ncbi:unnamed protein product [Nippostrongylus brasiliensis]|uniref:Lipoprotein n=1 Tax=Nippostrongylus brasiliensis TaxID=27835 RepID=A0A0N4YZF9_NIPBR|nr:unnamed protein product [Nippostrongylus brasiliensis]
MAGCSIVATLPQYGMTTVQKNDVKYEVTFTKREDDGYELDVDGVPNPRFREHRSNRDCACGQPDLSQMIYDDRGLRHLGHLKDHCEDLMR